MKGNQLDQTRNWSLFLPLRPQNIPRQGGNWICTFLNPIWLVDVPGLHISFPSPSPLRYGLVKISDTFIDHDNSLPAVLCFTWNMKYFSVIDLETTSPLVNYEPLLSDCLIAYLRYTSPTAGTSSALSEVSPQETNVVTISFSGFISPAFPPRRLMDTGTSLPTNVSVSPH